MGSSNISLLVYKFSLSSLKHCTAISSQRHFSLAQQLPHLTIQDQFILVTYIWILTFFGLKHQLMLVSTQGTNISFLQNCGAPSFSRSLGQVFSLYLHQHGKNLYRKNKSWTLIYQEKNYLTPMFKLLLILWMLNF